MSLSDIWIDTKINVVGPKVKLRGMPAPIGPVPGLLNLSTFWMMMADACRILSFEDIPVKVKGDEPKLSGDKVPWVKVADPLLDNFFEEIMREIESLYIGKYVSQEIYDIYREILKI